MTRRETPIEWKELLDSRQIYSLRALAEKLDVSPQTATRLVHGESTSRETIEAAAELLGVTTDRIRELRHEAPLPPFRLPPEADRLGQRQRTAIVAVVRAMLEPDDATAMTEAQIRATMRADAKATPVAPEDMPSGDGATRGPEKH